ncbi:class I SAM-dependent methyltransferase [Calditrichota bacterium]
MSSRFVIDPHHPIYLRAAAREAQTWGRPSVQVSRSRRPRDHPLVSRYLAKLVSGTESYEHWLDWFLDHAAPFNTALSLGAGSGIIEERLLRAGVFKSLEVVDLSGTAVESFQARLKGTGIDTVVTSRIADLNFISLPAKRYDFILAHTCLHHILNLEHLLEEVRKALLPDGLFLIYDFIGPSGWQWSYDTLAEVNKALDLSRARHPELIIHKVARPDQKKVKAFSPFESVRSDEILNLIRTGFEPRVEVLTDRLLYTILHYGVEMDDWENPILNKWLQEMIDWEDSLKNGGELAPYTLWGAYYPTQRRLHFPERLTEEEIQNLIGVKRFNPRGMALNILDKLPFREKVILSWMRYKRKHRKY